MCSGNKTTLSWVCKVLLILLHLPLSPLNLTETKEIKLLRLKSGWQCESARVPQAFKKVLCLRWASQRKRALRQRLDHRFMGSIQEFTQTLAKEGEAGEAVWRHCKVQTQHTVSNIPCWSRAGTFLFCCYFCCSPGWLVRFSLLDV